MSKSIGIVSLCFMVLLVSCQGNSGGIPGQKRQGVIIAGSTSVMPFTEKLAEHFMIDHPLIAVDVQGGGSTAGIQACLNKTVDIGMSSRELKQEEKVLKEITICRDGISIVVHPMNRINALTLDQVKSIFSGRIKTWSELGWVNRRIDAVTREEGSGTRASFEELVMRGGDIDDGIMVQDSNGSVKEVVATDPYAIGYISLGLVDKRVKPLSVNGVMPTVETIRAKKYRLVRPFVFVTLEEVSDPARAFIQFVLSRDGQNILKKEGLIGIQ